MPRTRPPYPQEFRERIAELARAVRSPTELAEEFEPCYGTIRSWIEQADLGEGRRSDGTTTVEREEVCKPRKELRRLKQEREDFGTRAETRMAVFDFIEGMVQPTPPALGA
jgi:transposase